MKLSAKLAKAIHEPVKILRFAGARFRALPFVLRLDKLVFGSNHLAYAPERYTTNIAKYRADASEDFFDSRDLHKWTAGNYSNNSGDRTRFFFLNLVCDQIIKDGIEGDVAELGVYKGNSAFLLAKLARKLERTAYCYDTFAGFDTGDLAGADAAVDNDAFSDTSLGRVRRLVGDDNVVYVKGHFPKSLEQVDDSIRYCLVHIDCDLYEPFRAALEYFYPRLTAGGFLIMHDYGGLSWAGAEQAVDEFFLKQPERPILIPDKSGTAVVRKSFVSGGLDTR